MFKEGIRIIFNYYYYLYLKLTINNHWHCGNEKANICKTFKRKHSRCYKYYVLPQNPLKGKSMLTCRTFLTLFVHMQTNRYGTLLRHCTIMAGQLSHRPSAGKQMEHFCHQMTKNSDQNRSCWYQLLGWLLLWFHCRTWRPLLSHRCQFLPYKEKIKKKILQAYNTESLQSRTLIRFFLLDLIKNNG